MTYFMEVTCPHCGARHDAATAVMDKGSTADPRPGNGDATLCINCGRFSVFDSSANGGLRKPRRKETRQLESDNKARTTSLAWSMMNRERAKH